MAERERERESAKIESEKVKNEKINKNKLKVTFTGSSNITFYYKRIKE